MEAVLDDRGAVILDEIAMLEVERTRIESKIARRALDFCDLRRRESELALDPRIGKLEASFAADELSLVLRQPAMTVQSRVAEARRVRGLLPLTWAAWAGGRIDQVRIRLIADAVDKLDGNHSIIELDYRVVDYAAGHTVAQLKSWLNRFVAHNEPDRERAGSAFERRSIYLDPDEDGMTWLHALIHTTDAVRIDSLLTGLVKQTPADGCALGQHCTLQQRRADLFAGILLGRVDLAGSATGRVHGGAVIGVTVPVTTLVGLDDTPGESFDQRFVLPAGMVRELAAEPGTLFYRLLTDRLGRILDVTEIGRFPSTKLHIALNMRDGTCAFPTCNVPATNCDADHVIPAPRGPTTADNLRNLCRRHHRFKTFGIVDTTIGPPGHQWHLPAGKTVRSKPSDATVVRQVAEGPALEIDFAHFTINQRHAA